MKILDLSWGQPSFLYPYWDKIDLSIPSNISMSYSMGGLPELKEAIRNLHIQEQNANVLDKHIVVGVGATQILSAILKVIDKPVHATAPFFSRFPFIAYDSAVPWKVCKHGIEIITNPNNPDGKINLSDSKFRAIYDLSYNWPQYTTPIKYNNDIMVFSLAKATGHASTRIGWAIFKDADLAREVEDTIEYLSSGIALESQLKAIKIIKSQLKRKNTCFQYGKKILLDRHNQLNQMKLPFRKLNHSGMFLWAKSLDVVYGLKLQKIKCMEGMLFGCRNDHARINIGCSNDEFKEFIKRIKNYNKSLLSE